jgi:hypothetical protein
VAGPGAPFSILGTSPAPLLIVLGTVLWQAFFVWTRRRRARGKSQLLSLRVLDSSYERTATDALLIIGALGPAVNFLLPLYIEFVQHGTSLQMAVAVTPYSLAIFARTTLVGRLFDRVPPRQIGRAGFVVVTCRIVPAMYQVI